MGGERGRSRERGKVIISSGKLMDDAHNSGVKVFNDINIDIKANFT